MFLQIEKQSWRGSLARCRVTVYQHFDDTLSLGFGFHELGKFTVDGQTLKAKTTKSREKQPAVLMAGAN